MHGAQLVEHKVLHLTKSTTFKLLPYHCLFVGMDTFILLSKVCKHSENSETTGLGSKGLGVCPLRLSFVCMYMKLTSTFHAALSLTNMKLLYYSTAQGMEHAETWKVSGSTRLNVGLIIIVRVFMLMLLAVFMLANVQNRESLKIEQEFFNLFLAKPSIEYICMDPWTYRAQGMEHAETCATPVLYVFVKYLQSNNPDFFKWYLRNYELWCQTFIGMTHSAQGMEHAETCGISLLITISCIQVAFTAKLYCVESYGRVSYRAQGMEHAETYTYFESLLKQFINV